MSNIFYKKLKYFIYVDMRIIICITMGSEFKI